MNPYSGPAWGHRYLLSDWLKNNKQCWNHNLQKFGCLLVECDEALVTSYSNWQSDNLVDSEYLQPMSHSYWKGGNRQRLPPLPVAAELISDHRLCGSRPRLQRQRYQCSSRLPDSLRASAILTAQQRADSW